MSTPTKVTREHLGMRIASADYVVMPDGRTTVCQLTMQNGFTVRGESSCVSAENFNKELGEKYAYEKAFDAAWAFEGYLLAELRHREARGDENQYREEQEKARRDVLLALMDMLMVSDTDALLRRVTALREAHTVVGSFGWALEQLRAGKRVARKGWNGKGMWVCVIDPGSAMFQGARMQPCLGLRTVSAVSAVMQPGWMPSQQDMLTVGWVPSQQDMLTVDWVIVE